MVFHSTQLQEPPSLPPILLKLLAICTNWPIGRLEDWGQRDRDCQWAL